VKIAVFYSDSPWASWSLSQGLPLVIERMGHDVLSAPFPPSTKITKAQEEAIRAKLPTAEQLKACDLILVCGPEHLKEWIKHYYREWKQIQTPKAGWYHEDMVRLASEHRILYDSITPLIDFHFMPNAIDAEKYKAEWVPVGVDTEMFCRKQFSGSSREYWEYPARDIDCAFIGLLYEKRKKFLEQFQLYINGIDFKVGHVIVQDLDGINIQKSAELLAETYSRTKVLVNFPSLSNVLVSKVLEAAACGSYVVSARQDGVDSPASSLYPADAPNIAADQVRHALNCESMRQEHARKSCEYVRRNHRMELRLEKIFQSVGVQVG
jgi:hypothetical protein